MSKQDYNMSMEQVEFVLDHVTNHTLTDDLKWIRRNNTKGKPVMDMFDNITMTDGTRITVRLRYTWHEQSNRYVYLVSFFVNSEWAVPWYDREIAAKGNEIKLQMISRYAIKAYENEKRDSSVGVD